MDDLKDHLQLSEELTDLLRRVREAIEAYGEWTVGEREGLKPRGLSIL